MWMKGSLERSQRYERHQKIKSVPFSSSRFQQGTPMIMMSQDRTYSSLSRVSDQEGYIQ